MKLAPAESLNFSVKGNVPACMRCRRGTSDRRQFVQRFVLPGTSEMPGAANRRRATRCGRRAAERRHWAVLKPPTVKSLNVPKPLESVVLGLEMNTAKTFDTDPVGPVAGRGERARLRERRSDRTPLESRTTLERHRRPRAGRTATRRLQRLAVGQRPAINGPTW